MLKADPLVDVRALLNEMKKTHNNEFVEVDQEINRLQIMLT